MLDLDTRCRYVNAKIRNIIYYRLTVEESLWESEGRFRCQYMHVMRGLRSQVQGLIRDMQKDDTRISFYQGIVNLISPKIKNEDCMWTIRQMEEYVKRSEEGEKES